MIMFLCFPCLGQKIWLRPSEHDSRLRHRDVWRSGRNQLSVVQWVRLESGYVSLCTKPPRDTSTYDCVVSHVCFVSCFVQGSMWVLWSPGWSGPGGLSMTSGGIRSMWPVGWTAREYQERYRYQFTPLHYEHRAGWCPANRRADKPMQAKILQLEQWNCYTIKSLVIWIKCNKRHRAESLLTDTAQSGCLFHLNSLM